MFQGFFDKNLAGMLRDKSLSALQSTGAHGSKQYYLRDQNL